MNQTKTQLTFEEIKSQTRLLSQVDTFRLQLVPRVCDAAQAGELTAIRSEGPSSTVWSAMVHHSLGSNHYFAFSGEGMAVFSPISDAGDEVQLDLSIALAPEVVTAVGQQVCNAIQTFGPLLDGHFLGMPARVVPGRIDLGFLVKGVST